MPAIGAVHRIITGAPADRTQVQIPGPQRPLSTPSRRGDPLDAATDVIEHQRNKLAFLRLMNLSAGTGPYIR